jgi:hypothetical protein
MRQDFCFHCQPMMSLMGREGTFAHNTRCKRKGKLNDFGLKRNLGCDAGR